MSSGLWDEIGARMRSHGYMKGVERTVERVRRNGEIFTPTDLVIEMIARSRLTISVRGAPSLTRPAGTDSF